MLYIGHFSFDETNITGLARQGYVTMLTTATSAGDAVAAFKSTIQERKENDKRFEAIHVVYLEDVIEITALPENPIITRLQSSAGEFPESIGHSLQGTRANNLQAYGLSVDLAEIEKPPVQAYKELTSLIRFAPDK